MIDSIPLIKLLRALHHNDGASRYKQTISLMNQYEYASGRDTTNNPTISLIYVKQCDITINGNKTMRTKRDSTREKLIFEADLLSERT